jgi:hypothetical protein
MCSHVIATAVDPPFRFYAAAAADIQASIA